MNKKNLLIVAVALIVLGVASFFLLNGSKPEAVCAPADATATSGFVDDETGCPITIDSYNEIREYESSPKIGRIIGLVLIVAGVAVGVVAAARKPKPGAPH